MGSKVVKSGRRDLTSDILYHQGVVLQKLAALDGLNIIGIMLFLRFDVLCWNQWLWLIIWRLEHWLLLWEGTGVIAERHRR